LEKVGFAVHKRTRNPVGSADMGYDAELELEFDNRTMTVWLQLKNRLNPSAVSQIAGKLRSFSGKSEIMLGAPTLSAETQRRLSESGLNYVDATGACLLRGEGLFVRTAGDQDLRRAVLEELSREKDRSWKPELRVSAGRLSIIRALLDKPDKERTVSDLANLLGLNPSTVSRMFDSLDATPWAEKTGRGRLKLHEPGAVLEFWRDSDARLGRRFHAFRLGAGNYGEFKVKIRDAARDDQQCCHTLWSAAELLAGLMPNPRVGLYVSDVIGFASEIGALPANGQSGNLYLAALSDRGLPKEAMTVQDQRVAPAHQVYVDLWNAPFRGKSLAVQLREAAMGF